jgi:predicted ATPase
VDILASIPSRWELHYDLCLELYIFAASVDFCLGNDERARRSVDEVLSNARAPRDKLPAYVTLAEGLGLREQHKEALELDLKALSLISNFPKRFLPFHLLADINALKTIFRKRTDEEILSLPVIEDENKVLALKILSSMWIRAYLCQNIVLSLLCMTRALRMTFQYGLSPPGSLAFAAYGSLLCGPLADHSKGVRLGRLSHGILRRTNGADLL